MGDSNHGDNTTSRLDCRDTGMKIHAMANKDKKEKELAMIINRNANRPSSLVGALGNLREIDVTT